MNSDRYWNSSHIDHQNGGTQVLNASTVLHELQHNNMNPQTTNPRLVSGVVVLLLMVLNLCGNSLVFYVYRFRVKPGVFSFFVTVLAAQDVLTGLTTMLIDVIVKMRPVDENVLNLTVLCKITHFEVYTQSLISGCVLTLIAYQRYRKICHPLEPGFQMKTAKLSLAVIAVSCIVLTSPMLVINGPQEIQVAVNNQPVNVTICRYEKTYEKTLFQVIFSIFLVLAFSLVLCLTIIFYVMVAKALRKFERRNSRSTKSFQASPRTDVINQEQGYTFNRLRQQVHKQLSRQSRTSIVSSGYAYEGISTHMYRTFATITAIFIISYLPHLVVLILTMTLKLDYQVLTFTERLLVDLAYNCPYISTVANPIIYGFHNTEFREHLRHVLTCRRRR